MTLFFSIKWMEKDVSCMQFRGCSMGVHSALLDFEY